MSTRLQELLGIALPIIQAPMAGVQGSALAIAVSNAGGLGSLPCAMLGADRLHAELMALHAQTTRPFNVNFFCHTPPTTDLAQESAWRATLLPFANELGLAPETPAAAPDRLPFNAEMAAVLAPFAPPVVSFHFGLPSADHSRTPQGSAQQGRSAYGPDQLVHRSPGARHRKPHHARAWSPAGGCTAVSSGRSCCCAIARPSGGPGQW